jgi:hypothetical protein
VLAIDILLIGGGAAPGEEVLIRHLGGQALAPAEEGAIRGRLGPGRAPEEAVVVAGASREISERIRTVVRATSEGGPLHLLDRGVDAGAALA